MTTQNRTEELEKENWFMRKIESNLSVLFFGLFCFVMGILIGSIFL